VSNREWFARRDFLQSPALVALVVGAVALSVRLPRLGSPGVEVFDEIYYAGDAADLLARGVESGRPAHPPLGKWLISAGIEMFGFTPFGWRVAAVVAGAVTAAMTCLIAQRLTASRLLGALAGLMIVVDGIMFTTSRLALLDGFAAMFLVLAAHAMVRVLDSQAEALHRWQLWAAVWLGLGIAVKWSVAFAIPVLVIVVVVRARRDGGGWRRPLLSVGTVLVVSIACYLVTFIPTWIANPSRANPVDFLSRQWQIAQFHLHLQPRNRYASPAVDWLAQKVPTGLFVEHCPAGREASVVCPHSELSTTVVIAAVANPVVWLCGIGAIIALVGLFVARRQAVHGVLLALMACQWVPWMFTRDGYSFYAATLIPFMAIGAVVALNVLPRKVVRVSAGFIAVSAIAAFVFFYPYLAATPMTDHQLRLREWLSTWP
jgi:dolichyl-phosphate-mannose-protein mannosyltransferase